jgi:ectoine hydroxylase-related dioxygenase (phytanoyl-CoA dioxygenase family)
VALSPPDVVTAWLALTPSDAANGCLRFLPGSHRQQLPHVDTFAQGNLLLKGQAIQVRRDGGCSASHRLWLSPCASLV